MSLGRLELPQPAPEASALSTELQGPFESFHHICYNIHTPMQRILTLSISLFLLAFISSAQAQDSTEPPDVPEEISTEDSVEINTVEESPAPEANTVPGSVEEFLQQQAEQAQETSDSSPAQEDNPNDEETELTDFDKTTHLLKFNYESRVVVTNTTTEIAFLEIDYTIKLEEPIEITERSKQTTGRANIMTDVVGVLGSNDLFTCELDVEIDDVDVSITTKQITTFNEYNDPTDSQLTLQLNFSKSDLLEDWFSYCSAVDGSRLNTQGEQEKYLYETLKATQPGLDGLIIDDFESDEEASLNLFTEEIILDDLYGDEEFSLTGSGRIDVEPIEKE